MPFCRDKLMPEKILLVDDDADFRSELRDFLTDYTIIEAGSGAEALSILHRAHEIGLVLLDVMMPGISGIDLLAEIKKTDPNIRIVMLTGYSSKDVAIAALKGHADDYIEKPLNVEKMNDVINRLLSKRQGEDGLDTAGIKGKIEKVMRFVEKNCYKKTTLKEAAEAVYLSPKYLSRIFKQTAGQSFTNYKLRIKMNKAKELLKKTSCTVNQISEKLCYENAESFIRQFKKLAKKTPTEYRHTIARKKAKKKSSRR